MKTSLVIFIAIILVTFLGFAWLTVYSLNELEPLEVPATAVEGKKIWQKNGCIECHTLFGNGGYAAPDLTKELSQVDSQWLKDFLTDPPIIRTSKHKRHLQLSDEEADKIVDFLRFTNEITIPGGWPPKPVNFTERRQ